MSTSGDNSGTVPAAPRRRRRVLATVAWIVLGLLAAGLAAAWILRDAPRALVERTLAARLQAEVALGRLEIRGWTHVVLGDLTVRRMAGQPRLDRVHIVRLDVRGRLPELAEARMETVTVSGMTVRIAPPPAGPFPEPKGPPPAARAGRIVIEPADIELAGSGAPQHLELRGELADYGTRLSGRLTVRGTRLAAAPLFAIAGLAPAPGDAVLDEPHLDVTLSDGGGRVNATLAASRLLVDYGSHRVSVPRPRVVAGLVRSADGTRLDVAARPEIAPVAQQLALTATVDATTFAPGAFALDVHGLDLATLAAFVPVTPAGMLDVAGTLDVEARRERADAPLIVRAGARIESARSGTLQARAIDATVQASLAPGRGGPVVVHAAVGVLGGTFGSLRVPGALSGLTVDADGTLDLAPAAPGAPRGLPAVRGASGRLSARTPHLGAIEADGDIALAGAPAIDVRWRWTGGGIAPLLAAVRESAPGTVPKDLVASGTITAQGNAAGPIAAPRIAADIEVHALSASGLPASAAVTEAGAATRVSWDGRTVALDRITGHGTVTAPPLAPQPVTFTARHATIDPRTLSSELADAVVESGTLGRATASATWTGHGGRAGVRLERLDLARARDILRPLGDPVPGFSVKGSLAGTVEATLGQDGWTAAGPLRVEGAGLSSADGSRVVEGVASDLRLEANGSFARPPFDTARVAGSIGGAQVLWGSLFGDFGAVTATLDAALHRAPGVAPGWTGEGSVRFPGSVRVATRFGIPGAGAATFDVTIDAPRLGEAVHDLAQAPFAGVSPLLDTLRAEGAATVHVVGTVSANERTAAGEFRAQGIGLHAGTTLDLAGLDVVLPFDVRLARADASRPFEIGGAPREGHVQFASLAAGGFKLPPLSTALHVQGDNVRLEDAITVPLFGGRLVLDSFTLAEFTRPTRSARSGLSIEKLQLPAAMSAFGLPPLEGTVDARFPRIEFTGNTFAVDGGGQVEVFGGRVTFGEIGGQDLFTRFPKVRLSAEFHGIDLARVTGAFDFGEMTGLVGGYVRPLELFGWVPVRFDAEVRTELRSGVPRTINVKAINNVAILGTGGNVSVLDRGLQRFFKRYTYSRLGVHLTLAEDAFLLVGLEHRGKRELFLKGRLPLPIDVVNAQPGHTVSFRSMIDRFSAIDFGGATTKPPAATNPGPG